MGVTMTGPGGERRDEIDWDDLKRRILEKLDVAAEYRALGVRFSASGPNAKGWQECHAIDREDHHPSAAVHIPTGIYNDLGGGQKAKDLFKFAVVHGVLGGWSEVMRHYAAKVGVPFGQVARSSGGRIREDLYFYKDATDVLCYGVFRYRLPNGEKTFTQHPPDGKGGWIRGEGCMDGISPLPYRLPELLAADPAEDVLIVEGEKDVDRARAEGFVATTNHGGCKAFHRTWERFDFRHFSDRNCFILPDNDPGGREHARKVAAYLHGVARSVKVIDLPDLPHGGDLSDWLDLGGTVEDLCQLCHDAPEWTPMSGPGPECPGPEAMTEKVGPEVEGLFSMATRADLGILRAEDVDDEPILWLDQDRVAIGKMHLTAGEGGDGKSQAEIANVAAFTTGNPTPCGGTPYRTGTCIILAAEDGYADVVKPRLVATGADLSRVRFLTARFTIKGKDGKPQIHPVDFQRLDYWQAVFEMEGPIYFVADPIPAYLGQGVNDHKNIDVRSVLEPFGALCLDHGVAWSAVTHLGKSPDLKTPTHKILGSVAYANLARIVHITARDQEDQKRRYWLQIKNNYAPLQPPFEFVIEGHDYTSARGKAIRTSRVVFDATSSNVNLSDVMGNGSAQRPAQAVEVWLMEQFPAPGLHVASVEIFRRAESMGISRRTLYRLKSKLGIWATKVEGHAGKEWMWYRPVQADDAPSEEEKEEEGGSSPFL